MTQEPFIYLYSRSSGRRVLSVPPGYEGFVLHDDQRRLRLLCGMHDLACPHVAAVFLVRVGGSHALDLRSLGGAMLHGADGRWRPLKVLGRLAYGVVRPELLVDLLEREQIYETRQLGRELARMVVELLSNVLDGEGWRAEKLSENLDMVSGEVLRRLAVALAPIGLIPQGLELVADDSALRQDLGAQAYPA